MSINALKDRPTVSFIFFGTLILGLIIFIEKINSRFWLNDFKVMYMAAEALLSNEQVYGTPFGLGTGFFKYSPFTGLLFVPYTIVSFEIASIVHFFISGFAAIGTVILVEQIIRVYLVPVRRKTFFTLTAVLFCVLLHLVRELHLGNINMALLFLLSLSLYSALNSKPIASGVLLALAILAKPYFIILFLPLLANKRYKGVIYTGASIVLFAFIPVAFMGISKSINLYQEWITAMMDHNEYLYSNHTVFELINTYIGISIPTEYSPILLILLAILSSIYFWKTTHKPNDESKSFNNHQGALIVHFFLLIALVPSVLITDTEHFLFSLPLIAILLFHLRKEAILPVVLFILLIFMYEGNSTDLLGKDLSGKVEDYGILGISNLIIIGTAIFWFLQNRKKWVALIFPE